TLARIGQVRSRFPSVSVVYWDSLMMFEARARRSAMRFDAQAVSVTVLLVGVGTWYSGPASGQSTSDRPYRIVKGHSQDVRSLSWNPDGAKLAYGGGDGSVRMWEAATLTERRVLRSPSPDITDVPWSHD